MFFGRENSKYRRNLEARECLAYLRNTKRLEAEMFWTQRRLRKDKVRMVDNLQPT